ncbi:MAG: Verru_Chthon cassette protein B [Chthoniobacteraceae bacterium]|nr:Verru_Chthon cassette protein B [Chthoniobacteraceae bacterium]
MKTNRRSDSAFSLVEVIIALSIISVSLVSVVGLMPACLGSMREAVDQTAKAQIVERVADEVMLTPFSGLAAYAAKSPFYFDDQGTLQKAKDSNTRYEVKLASAAADYPGAEDGATLTTNIAAFSLEIARWTGSAEIGASKYVIYVPNSGN